MRIQISSGKGPIECEYAVGLYAKKLINDFNLEIINQKENKKNCYSSIILSSKDEIDVETGTVQWICESPFRKHHKRKNWFIDVSILQDYEIEDNMKVIYDVFHSGGKGGQNVNKVATAIRATDLVTGISVVCQNERHQLMNKKMALKKLREKIEQLHNDNIENMNYDNWNIHNNIERGNPIKIFTGLDFKEK